LINQVDVQGGVQPASTARSQNIMESGSTESSSFARKLDEALAKQNGDSNAEVKNENKIAGEDEKAQVKEKQPAVAKAEDNVKEKNAEKAAEKNGKTGASDDAAQEKPVDKNAARVAVKPDQEGKKSTAKAKQTAIADGQELERKAEGVQPEEFKKTTDPAELQERCARLGSGKDGTNGDAAASSSSDAVSAGAETAADTVLQTGAGEITAKTAADQDPVNGENADSNRAGKTAAESPRVVLEVRDYRTRAAAENSQSAGRADKAKGDAIPHRSADIDRDLEMPQIRLVKTWNGGAEGVTSSARPARGSTFSAFLRETMNNQIVKQSGIVLRNDNQGEIRLVLKPEHLGRVRLRIQLDENRLSGRIFVDSNFVKESFEQNMSSLYRAFKNSGFEASGFEVLVDGGEQRNAPDGSQKDPTGEYAGLAAKTSQQFDDAVPILEGYGWQSDLVNLVV